MIPTAKKKSCPKSQVWSDKHRQCIKEPYRVNPVYVYIGFILVAVLFIVGFFAFAGSDEVESRADIEGWVTNPMNGNSFNLYGSLFMLGIFITVLGFLFIVPWTPPFGLSGTVSGILVVLVGLFVTYYFYEFFTHSFLDFLFRLGMWLGVALSIPFLWPTGLKGLIIGGIIFVISYIFLVWGFLVGL